MKRPADILALRANLIGWMYLLEVSNPTVTSMDRYGIVGLNAIVERR